jgi:dihydrofolate reductase
MNSLSRSIPPFLSSISAVSLDGIIGIDGKLPWDLPEDLKRFRDLTKGKKILMGRKTFDSIGRPLPHRENFVLTRDSSAVFPAGVVAVSDFQSQLRAFYEENQKTGEEIFVIGGEDIYRKTLPWVKNLYLTEVDVTIGRKDAARFPYFAEIRGEDGMVPFHETDGATRVLRFQEIKKEERQQPLLSFRFLDYLQTE